MSKLFLGNYKKRYDKYNECTYTITLDTLMQTQSDFMASNTGFRKLIVTEWMDKVLGEPPKITKVNRRDKTDFKEIPFDFIDDVADILHDTLAYGFVFVVPENKMGEIDFKTLTPDKAKDLDYVYDDNVNKLTYLAYTEVKKSYDTKDEDTVDISYRHTHIYDYVTRVYTHTLENLSNSSSSTVDIRFDVDNMPPFFASTRDNLGLWENADRLIEDIDKTYVEMLLDMELSRKLVLIPESFLETGARKGLTTTPRMKTSRLFRTFPNEGDSGDNSKPVIFDGKFNPEPFINTINIISHQISLKTGFGKGYFSFDKYEGFKTATEITAGRVDMNLAKTKVNIILEKIIKAILMVKNPNKTEDDYIITVADSIIEDSASYKEKLFNDVINGLISKEFYLKQSYNKTDVSELIPSAEEQAYFYGMKNNTGLNTLEDNKKSENLDNINKSKD